MNAVLVQPNRVYARPIRDRGKTRLPGGNRHVYGLEDNPAGFCAGIVAQEVYRMVVSAGESLRKCQMVKMGELIG